MTLHKKPTKSKHAQTHKRTIARELHEQWRKMYRTGDGDLLADELKVSKPTIDNAIIYGCVHKQKLVDGITKFFQNRLQREAAAARALQLAERGIFTTEQDGSTETRSSETAGGSVQAEAPEGERASTGV